MAATAFFVRIHTFWAKLHDACIGRKLQCRLGELLESNFRPDGSEEIRLGVHERILEELPQKVGAAARDGTIRVETFLLDELGLCSGCRDP